MHVIPAKQSMVAAMNLDMLRRGQTQIGKCPNLEDAPDAMTCALDGLQLC